MFTRRELFKRTPVAVAIALTIPMVLPSVVKPAPRTGISIDPAGLRGYGPDGVIFDIDNNGTTRITGDLISTSNISAGHTPISRDLMGSPLAIMPRDLIQTRVIE